MKILGLKLTHDGAIAVIDNGELIFSYEMEKLNNSPRLSEFNIGLGELESILNRHGYSIYTMDEIVIDGWGYVDVASKEDDITVLNGFQIDDDISIDIEVAKYGRVVHKNDTIMIPSHFSSEILGLSYSSYLHVTGHIFSAYCTSPFSKKIENSYVLVWDGGMAPQLFYYNPTENTITNEGILFSLVGDIYTGFAYEYAPFNTVRKHDYSVAGKLMAYIAVGNVHDGLIEKFKEIYESLQEKNITDLNPAEIETITKAFINESKAYVEKENFQDKDVLCSFHVFLEQMLIEKLAKKINESSGKCENICFVGGCALSIKWNSRIRDSGIFKNVYVPPFPNDSGSAIGTACAAMILKTNFRSINWNVYSGPEIIRNDDIYPEYTTKPFSLKELAALLYQKGEPVVFLNGKAELGPRALGNRSILASADNPRMKQLLNKIKGREDYRPVAPICLEEEAMSIFDPGSPDPYMLFEHTVKNDWKEKIPAIVHLDGTARLQTVNIHENSQVYELLSHYKDLSGIGLLCNTSANLNGSGFFPDIKSAAEWGKLNYIWCENILYTRKAITKLFT